MKKVILIVTSCTINGEVHPLDYKEQLLGLVCNPTGGMDLAKMRNIEKVYDKLVEVQCPGSMLLEDAEFTTMKDILEAIIFKVFDKDIKMMIETVIAAEDYKVKPIGEIGTSIEA